MPALFGFFPFHVSQLWRNIWGLETPPCLEESTKDKSEGWLDRLVVGESRNVPKDKRARMRTAVDGMVDKVGQAHCFASIPCHFSCWRKGTRHAFLQSGKHYSIEHGNLAGRQQSGKIMQLD